MDRQPKLGDKVIFKANDRDQLAFIANPAWRVDGVLMQRLVVFPDNGPAYNASAYRDNDRPPGTWRFAE